MSLFCLLWTPLFYLFWRSVSGSRSFAGAVWAALAGCITAILQLFLGFAVDPGEFGLSRWLNGFVDIVVLPAMIPLFVYLLLVVFRVVTGPSDFANFAQVWLIPFAIIRALAGITENDPVFLVLVPFLWTAIAVGIPFFINIILNSPIFAIIPASLGIIVIPLASASSYWAFFCHRNSLGFLLLAAAAAPMLVSMVLSFRADS